MISPLNSTTIQRLNMTSSQTLSKKQKKHFPTHFMKSVLSRYQRCTKKSQENYRPKENKTPQQNTSNIKTELCVMIKQDLYQRCMLGLSQKSINVVHFINNKKKVSHGHLNILMPKKAFDKTYFFTIKNTQQTRNKKELPQPDKRTSTKTPQLITYGMVKDWLRSC